MGTISLIMANYTRIYMKDIFFHSCLWTQGSWLPGWMNCFIKDVKLGESLGENTSHDRLLLERDQAWLQDLCTSDTSWVGHPDCRFKPSVNISEWDVKATRGSVEWHNCRSGIGKWVIITPFFLWKYCWESRLINLDLLAATNRLPISHINKGKPEWMENCLTCRSPWHWKHLKEREVQKKRSGMFHRKSRRRGSGLWFASYIREENEPEKGPKRWGMQKCLRNQKWSQPKMDICD